MCRAAHLSEWIIQSEERFSWADVLKTESDSGCQIEQGSDLVKRETGVNPVRTRHCISGAEAKISLGNREDGRRRRSISQETCPFVVQEQIVPGHELNGCTLKSLFYCKDFIKGWRSVRAGSLLFCFLVLPCGVYYGKSHAG